jgi:hypothetical protein
LSGHQHYRLAILDEDGAAGLLGDFSGCQTELASPDLTFDRNFHCEFLNWLAIESTRDPTCESTAG